MPHAPISFRVVVWSVISGLAITLPVLWLVSLIPGLAREGAQAAHAQRLAAFYVHPGIVALKALVIFPVLEELFYRGLMMQLLRRYLPAWFAVGLPTVVFAASHISAGVPNVIFAFAIGLLLAWLVIKTGSLYASILCHAAVNFTVLFVLNPIFEAHGFTEPANFGSGVPLVVLALSPLLAARAMMMLRRERAPEASVAA